MKQVLIIRHASWDLQEDTLNSEGKSHAEALKPKLPAITRVLSSPLERAKQTAQIISGTDPEADERIAFPVVSEELSSQIGLARRTHPLGVAGAIYAIPAAREPWRQQAMRFLELVKEILAGLHDGETALIVSHDGIMVGLEKVLDNASFEGTDHTFGELEGFYLDEELNQTPFKP